MRPTSAALCTASLSLAARSVGPSAGTLSTELQVACARLRPKINRIARALLRNDADADDATQSSMEAILVAAPSYRGDGSFEGWANRIGVRTILRIARQRRLRGLRIAHADPDAVPSSPPEASEREALPRDLMAYLNALPEARRAVLVLKHAVGYSIDEIAELTGTSPGTVRDRLVAAREQVRKQIRRDAATGPRAVDPSARDASER